MVLSGALGNLTDRVLRGHVIDFLRLHHWPVFNVADVAIGVGASLLLLGVGGKRPPEPVSPTPFASS